jgi:hypothetical protein
MSVTWVKGHQDEDGDVLSVEAIYNIRADALAGQVTPSRHHPSVIEILPAERCRLAIRQKGIQGHYTKQIRQAFTLPAYYQYLEKRYGWTMDEINLIDWEVFQSASNNTNIDHVQRFKLVHLKLPTNSELAKANPHQRDTCHYCSERQTFHHLLKCSNSLSASFRDQVNEAVDLYLHLQEVPTPIARGLLYVIRTTLGLTQEYNLQQLDYPTIRCIEEQLRFGDQFLQGFLVTNWRTALEQHNRKYCIEQRRPPKDVIAGMVKLIWQEQLAFWEKHTSKIASPPAHSSSVVYNKLEMYKTKVRQLHRLKDSCLPSHRDQYFHDDIEGFLTTASCAQLKQ